MKSFICPECNSTEYKSHLCVSTYPDLNDPWSSILQQYECSKCSRYIPAHLAQLWEDISEEEAKNQWKKFYRDTK